MVGNAGQALQAEVCLMCVHFSDQRLPHQQWGGEAGIRTRIGQLGSMSHPVSLTPTIDWLAASPTALIPQLARHLYHTRWHREPRAVVTRQ